MDSNENKLGFRTEKRSFNFKLQSQQKQHNMSSETKKPINGSESGSGSGGFRTKLNHYLYSGEKKHVAAGIAVIGVIFGVPWYLMSRGSCF